MAFQVENLKSSNEFLRKQLEGKCTAREALMNEVQGFKANKGNAGGHY